MAVNLDPKKMRCASYSEVVEHLRAVLKVNSEHVVTGELLRLIESGSLPPFLFSMWLGIADSPNTIKYALEQKISVLIRLSAIKRLRKCLFSPGWKKTWNGLGGITGLISIFSDLSEIEIRDVCRAVAYSATGVDKEEKQECITELFKALQPSFFATSHKPLDQRPLQKYYKILVSACTEDTVSRFVEEHHQHIAGSDRRVLLARMPTVLQSQALRYIVDNYAAGDKWLTPLLNQYPPTATYLPAFSESMLFSLKVLKLLVEQQSAFLDGDRFMKELALPLLKRTLKKKAKWQQVQEIVHLTILYLRKISGLKDLGYERQGFLHLVGKCWSRKPELFAEDFEMLLGCSPKRSNSVTTRDFTRILHGVRKRRRFAVLRFCFKAKGYDLDNPEHLRHSIDMIPSTMLLQLPPDEALKFFTRLRSAKGDKELVERAASSEEPLLNHSPNDLDGDPDMWETVLLQRNGHQKKAEELASKQIQAWKKSAMTSSMPEQRGRSAKSVIMYAVASGSLNIYGTELIWMRRFTRDPLVLKSLWQNHAIEADLLLSGVPEIHLLEQNVMSYDVGARIVDANRILVDIFDTMISALREPSFALQDWRELLLLPAFVIKERVEQSCGLKMVLGISDGELYDVLWSDTIEMLITLEKKLLAPGCERLSANRLPGVIGTPLPRILEHEEPSTYRFLDNLAKARDGLWKEFRPTVHPSVTALPPPFPRGLPIQYLTNPYMLQLPSLEMYAPYLASRMHGTIFVDSKAASKRIPSDADSRAAIGAFVDDYAYALHLYVPKTLDPAERTSRIEKAWAYATGPLSYPRLSSEESIRYWESYGPPGIIFPEGWPNHIKVPPVNEDWPIVPSVDTPYKIEEWDPCSHYKPRARVFTLKRLKYIDLSRFPKWQIDQPTVNWKPSNLSISMPGELDDKNIWSRNRSGRAHYRPALREGLILSALLYLDSSNASSTRILSKPFPTSEEATVRYPALFLDDAFLSNKSLHDVRPSLTIDLLRTHIWTVPAPLLTQLVQNNIQRLEAMDSEAAVAFTLESTAFELVKLLKASDRPVLSTDLAIRCIIGRPGASSWHRQLLSPTLFKRLPASDAMACIRNFADNIIANVEKQATAKIEKTSTVFDAGSKESQLAAESSQKPFVKVTTIKFLAQILRGANFVSQEFVLSVLTRLLRKASHIDVRRAIVSSLLDALKSTYTSPDTSETILATLEVLIPIAGNIRERNPVTDSEWIMAEETSTLPELPDPTISEPDSPLFKSLLEIVENGPISLQDTRYCGSYVTRIILPILDTLKHQTMKWISIFLRKHGITEAEIDQFKIPPLPLRMENFEMVLQSCSAHVPLSLLEEYIAYLQFTVAPPPSISALNKKLRDNVDSHSSMPVRFWLHHFADPLVVSASEALISLFKKPDRLQNQVTANHIQEQFLKLFTLVLWNSGEDMGSLDEMMNHLWPRSRSNTITKDWAEHSKPIFEAAIMYVEGLRTKEWQKNPERKPQALPDTFKWRMWLLAYSAQHSAALDAAGTDRLEPKGNARDPHCVAFAAQVRKFTDAMAGTLYHAKFDLLKKWLAYLNVPGDKYRVACTLGDITKTRLSWLTMPDLLRVHLAAYLIGENKAEDEEVEQRIVDMGKSWRVCESEEVRKLGYDIAMRLETQPFNDLSDIPLR